MKRNREHGRIISVETLNRGSSLDADAAAGATSITVEDAGDFDEDGGWLYIGAQVVEFTACDDDTGVITLADPLSAAGEQGDPVAVYDPLYGEVVDYQLALVELDGEYDNPDPVTAEVAEGVGDLPEGDRGKAGESCVLKRVGEDEWEVVGVGGRPRKSRGVRWEQDDTHTLTAADVTAGTMTMPLTHRPADEALTCVLASVPQRPTEWTINYDAQTLTIPLDGWEKVGDVAWVHYAYRKGVATPTVSEVALPDSLVLWISADYEATRYSDGQSMPNVTNLVTMNTHPARTAQPIFRASLGPGGGPCFGTRLDSGFSIPWSVLNQVTPDQIEVLTVVNLSGGGGEIGFWRAGATGSGTWSHYPFSDGKIYDDFATPARPGFTPTMTLNTWRRYGANNDGTTAKRWLDEVQQYSGAQTFGISAEGFQIGTLNYGSTTGDNHRWGSLFLFNKVLTSDERAQVVAWATANPSGGMP